MLIPFFGFRVMVGMSLIMLFLSWPGYYLCVRERILKARWFLWLTAFSFPTGFIAVLSGWFVAEVGRQPWVIYGLLRTSEALTPTLSGPEVLFSLIAYLLAYLVIAGGGFVYIFRLLRVGPDGGIRQ